ncbi:MAG: aryl-sulfate sulfotransferase, partial [Rectinemataceae bacterium]
GAGGAGPALMPENKTPVSPNQGQTLGLFSNDPRASVGYTLLAPKHNTTTYLLDNQGRSVHQWASAYEPGQSAYLLPNGHLLRAGMLRVQGGTGGGEGGRIEEYDWDGKLVWEFEHATRDYQLHHDIKPLPNGHVLALMVERRTGAEAVAAGFDPRLLRDEYLAPDAVVEIEPSYPKGGRIVWQWKVWDHLVQDFDRTKANYGEVAAHPELIDTDCNGRATPAFWNHMNSLDYNAALDQILLSVRGCNEIWILDHSTTTAQAAGHSGGKSGRGGDLVYRWGNPAAYGRGSSADAVLVQQHDAEWIPDGSPGAGHILIFNNGYDRQWSSIEEIVPPVGLDGRYALAKGAAYGPERSVWRYEAAKRSDFFSSEISGAQRLPNGNTLICAGVVGNLFEVTGTGEMVWQYVNPVVRGGILAQGELPGKDSRGHLFNAVFKVHRYSPDFAGLKGRLLSPIGVIELPISQKGKTGLDRLDEVQREKAAAPGAAPAMRPPKPNPGPGTGTQEGRP